MRVEKLEKILRCISSTIQSIRIYTSDHPKANEAISEIFVLLKDYQRSFGDCEFGLAGDEFFSAKDIFFDLSKQLKDLRSLLQKNQIQRVCFQQTLLKQELESFLVLITENVDGNDFLELCKEKGISFSSIEFGLLGIKCSSDAGSTVKDRQKSAENFESLLSGNEELIKSLIHEDSVDSESAHKFSSDLFNLISFNRESLFTMMNLKRHDDYTFVHSLNVAVLSMFQAQYLGLDRRDIVRLGMAGMLHDSGKKMIKNQLLNKTEKLNDKEFRTMQSHTLAGAEAILLSESVDSIALIAAYQHHIGVRMERYPKAVFLKRQSVAAKIIAVSDVYDALRSRRSYKESMRLEQVYEIMQKEKGRILDTELVDLFFKHVGIWPEGTLVKLNTGEIAVVKKNNVNDMYSPVIEIVYDKEGTALEESDVVNLAKQTDLHIKRKIEKHITPDTEEGKKYVAGFFGE